MFGGGEVLSVPPLPESRYCICYFRNLGGARRMIKLYFKIRGGGNAPPALPVADPMKYSTCIRIVFKLVVCTLQLSSSVQYVLVSILFVYLQKIS